MCPNHRQNQISTELLRYMAKLIKVKKYIELSKWLTLPVD